MLPAENHSVCLQFPAKKKNHHTHSHNKVIDESSTKMASPRKLVKAALPGWVRDGELATDELKAVISSLTAKLNSKMIEEQIEGAEKLYSLIKTVWNLETHLARDAADLVCDELR